MRPTDEGLRTWCEKTWPAVYRHIYRLVQNRVEAEDLTQETYCRVVRKGFAASEPPHIGYLTAAATNVVRDSWRRTRQFGTISSLEDAVLAARPGDEGTSPRGVTELMAQLPDEYRQVLELRIIQGYSRAETACRMAKTEDAVRGLQYRALVALREALEEQERGRDDRD